MITRPISTVYGKIRRRAKHVVGSDTSRCPWTTVRSMPIAVESAVALYRPPRSPRKVSIRLAFQRCAEWRRRYTDSTPRERTRVDRVRRTTRASELPTVTNLAINDATDDESPRRRAEYWTIGPPPHPPFGAQKQTMKAQAIANQDWRIRLGATAPHRKRR